MAATAWLSPIDVVLAPSTFAALVGLVYAPQLVAMARASARRLRPLVPFLPHAAVVILFLWSLSHFYVSGLGLTRLIEFGGIFDGKATPALRAVPHAVDEGMAGYDGQFYAQMALDPLLRDRATLAALDNPDYRTRRILFSATAHVVGLGRPQWVVHVFAVQNVVTWLALAVLLLRWLPPGSARSVAAWSGCLLGQGLLSSVRYSLPDGPSLLLVALAVWAVEQGRGRLAALLVGVNGTGKETSLLSAGVVVEGRRWPHLVGELALRAALVALPLLVWMLYLRSLGLSASSGTANFGAPLSAYIDKWTITVAELRAQGWGSFARFSLFTLVGLTTQAAFLLWERDWRSAWWRAGVGYVALLAVLGPAVWGGYPGAATRVVLPLTVAFNVQVSKRRWFWPLWVAGNLNVLQGLEVIRVPWVSGLV